VDSFKFRPVWGGLQKRSLAKQRARRGVRGVQALDDPSVLGLDSLSDFLFAGVPVAGDESFDDFRWDDEGTYAPVVEAEFDDSGELAYGEGFVLGSKRVTLHDHQVGLEPVYLVEE